MRWGGREVVLARKSIWHVRNTASSLPSTSHPARHTRAKHLNRRWPDGCFTAAGVRDVGRASWRGIRVTAIRASASGVEGGESRQ